LKVPHGCVITAAGVSPSMLQVHLPTKEQTTQAASKKGQGKAEGKGILTLESVHGPSASAIGAFALAEMLVQGHVGLFGAPNQKPGPLVVASGCHVSQLHFLMGTHGITIGQVGHGDGGEDAESDPSDDSSGTKVEIVSLVPDDEQVKEGQFDYLTAVRMCRVWCLCAVCVWEFRLLALCNSLPGKHSKESG